MAWIWPKQTRLIPLCWGLREIDKYRYRWIYTPFTCKHDTLHWQFDPLTNCSNDTTRNKSGQHGCVDVGSVYYLLLLFCRFFIALLSHVEPYARISRLMSETHERITEKPPQHCFFCFILKISIFIFIFFLHLNLNLLLCELSKHVKVQVFANILMRVEFFQRKPPNDY